MNGQKPWCGPQEKSPGFWQMLIKASTLPGDIVLDCTAMTSETCSIHFGLWNRFIASIHLKHNFDSTSCHVLISMQALLSVLSVTWVTILWPLRKTVSCFQSFMLLWSVLQRFYLHQSLSLPTDRKILMVWRLFQPRSRKDVLVSKSALVVMEFFDIHLYMNFQFLTWSLYVKRLEQIEPTSPPPFLLSTGFLSKPSEVVWATSICRATSCSICSPVYYRPCTSNQVFRSSNHELMDIEACKSDRSTSHSMTASSSTTDSEDGSI